MASVIGTTSLAHIPLSPSIIKQIQAESSAREEPAPIQAKEPFDLALNEYLTTYCESPWLKNFPLVTIFQIQIAECFRLLFFDKHIPYSVQTELRLDLAKELYKLSKDQSIGKVLVDLLEKLKATLESCIQTHSGSNKEKKEARKEVEKMEKLHQLFQDQSLLEHLQNTPSYYQKNIEISRDAIQFKRTRLYYYLIQANVMFLTNSHVRQTIKAVHTILERGGVRAEYTHELLLEAEQSSEPLALPTPPLRTDQSVLLYDFLFHLQEKLTDSYTHFFRENRIHELLVLDQILGGKIKSFLDMSNSDDAKEIKQVQNTFGEKLEEVFTLLKMLHKFYYEEVLSFQNVLSELSEYLLFLANMSEQDIAEIFEDPSQERFTMKIREKLASQKALNQANPRMQNEMIKKLQKKSPLFFQYFFSYKASGNKLSEICLSYLALCEGFFHSLNLTDHRFTFFPELYRVNSSSSQEEIAEPPAATKAKENQVVSRKEFIPAKELTSLQTALEAKLLTIQESATAYHVRNSIQNTLQHIRVVFVGMHRFCDGSKSLTKSQVFTLFASLICHEHLIAEQMLSALASHETNCSSEEQFALFRSHDLSLISEKCPKSHKALMQNEWNPFLRHVNQADIVLRRVERFTHSEEQNSSVKMLFYQLYLWRVDQIKIAPSEIQEKISFYFNGVVSFLQRMPSYFRPNSKEKNASSLEFGPFILRGPLAEIASPSPHTHLQEAKNKIAGIAEKFQGNFAIQKLANNLLQNLLIRLQSHLRFLEEGILAESWSNLSESLKLTHITLEHFLLLCLSMKQGIISSKANHDLTKLLELLSYTEIDFTSEEWAFVQETKGILKASRYPFTDFVWIPKEFKELSRVAISLSSQQGEVESQGSSAEDFTPSKTRKKFERIQTYIYKNIRMLEQIIGKLADGFFS